MTVSGRRCLGLCVHAENTPTQRYTSELLVCRKTFSEMIRLLFTPLTSSKNSFSHKEEAESSDSNRLGWVNASDHFTVSEYVESG